MSWVEANTSSGPSPSSATLSQPSQQGHIQPNPGIDPRQLHRSNHPDSTVNSVHGNSNIHRSLATSSPSGLQYPPLSQAVVNTDQNNSDQQMSTENFYNVQNSRPQHLDQRPFNRSHPVQSQPIPPCQSHPELSPHYHQQRTQYILTDNQYHARPPDEAMGPRESVDVPHHIKTVVHAAMQRAAPSFVSAWKNTAAEVEIAMAQMTCSYDIAMKAEIARRETLERELGRAIQERDTGRQELQKFWDEKQRLFQDGMQIKALNNDLQKRCTNLDVDKDALRALVNKLQQEKASLAQELQKVQAETPSADDIAEIVQTALTEKYQENIANLVADAQRQQSLRLGAERKLAELEQQLQLPSTPTVSPTSLQDHYPTPISPSVPYPQFVDTSQTADTAGHPASSSSLIKFKHNDFQPLASSLHNQPDESSKRANPIVTSPPSPLPTPKSKGRTMSADKDPRWETGGEPKRRRIDKTAQTESTAGPSSDASQSKDRQSVIDFAHDDLPAWRVKVEPPGEDENDKWKERDDTDQLRDEDIARISTGTNHGRPSLGHVSPLSRPGLTGHLQYVYYERNDNLVCMFCMTHYTNADPQTVWPSVGSFPKGERVKILIAHLENTHAAACANIVKMSSAQLQEWKVRQMKSRPPAS